MGLVAHRVEKAEQIVKLCDATLFAGHWSGLDLPGHRDVRGQGIEAVACGEVPASGANRVAVDGTACILADHQEPIAVVLEPGRKEGSLAVVTG